MNSGADDERDNGVCTASEAEELETGEPISDEDGPRPVGKIAGLRGTFGGGTPAPPKPSKSNEGQVVLATAKYLKRDPEPELRREQQKRESAQEAPAQSLEGNVFNSGVLGGIAAMSVAVLWFVVGLMNDTLFFYPPVLFVLGLGALFKGLMQGK